MPADESILPYKSNEFPVSRPNYLIDTVLRAIEFFLANGSKRRESLLESHCRKRGGYFYSLSLSLPIYLSHIRNLSQRD
jgi:hypothetical protein